MAQPQGADTCQGFTWAGTGWLLGKPDPGVHLEPQACIQHLETGLSQQPVRSKMFRAEPTAGVLPIFNLTSKRRIKHWRVVTGQQCSGTGMFQFCSALYPGSFTQGSLQAGEIEQLRGQYCIQRGICLTWNWGIYNLSSCVLMVAGICCYTFQGFFQWLQETLTGWNIAQDLDFPRYFSINGLQKYQGRARNHSLNTLKGNEIKPTERQIGSPRPEYYYFLL